MKGPLILLCVLVIEAQSYILSPRDALAGCTISVNDDLGEPQPLILIPGAVAGQEWAYPTSGDKISVASGSTLQLECVGSNIKVGTTNLGTSSATATCVGGITFSVSSTQTSFTSVTCVSYPKHTARYTGATCENNNKEIEIGFVLGTKFLRTSMVCFDSVAQNTIWSRYSSSRFIGGRQTGFPRPSSFNSGSFYNVGGPIDDRYKIANQRIVVNRLLGLPDDSMKYVGSGDYYMARGHLTANADFIFGTQQRSTFWFVNVAPQWQTANGRNWNYLESDVRDFQAGRPNDILVYTGTYGIATLPHEQSSNQIPLYLYVDGNNRGVPVPEILWKVAYDPVQKAAIAFVIANNPYKNTVNSYCTNICNQITWLSWNPSNVTAGLGYCCDVRELRQTITFIPSMDVTSILQ